MESKQGRKSFDKGVFLRLMGFAQNYRLRFVNAAIAALLLSVAGALRPFLFIKTVDDNIQLKDAEGLLYYVLLMLGLLLFEVLLQFVFIYEANWLGQQIIKDLRTKVFAHVVRFKMAYLNNSSVGKLVTRIVSDTETIASFFSQGLFMIISDLLKMIVISGLMIYKNWQLSLIAFAVMPVMLYATQIFQRYMKKAFQEVRVQVANLNSFVQERVTGMKIVQLFSREQQEYKNFIEINEKHKNAHIKTVLYNSIFFPVAEILSALAIGLLVWYGGLNAAQDGSVQIGEIMGFIMMAQMLYRPLRQIADKFNSLQMGMVAGDRVFKIIDTDSSISDRGTEVLTEAHGEIEFKDVKFSYIPDELVLRGISFKLKPGETVAIVGATGAGKSTIINLINRFYEIDSGDIMMDGRNVKDYSLRSLRDQVGVVLQDVFLFSDTILNNITLGKGDVSREEVIDAAKKIGIHDFIMSLPDNYDYNVKERGAMLSAGQRQLIAFLRVYVSNPGVLILDEATSSVDAYSEHLIQLATDTLTQDRTSIVIAHRLATVKKADRIIVLDKGEIVEQGNHSDLLKIEKGFYRNLYDQQFAMEQAS
ncbi:MAG: ABC transporter ATP-binding protein [Flavobacteriaceae bacterium]